MLFTGSATALVTPFTSSGVNTAELKNLIEFQITNGTKAIILLGTTGEPCTMTYDEKLLAMQTARGCINGRVPLIIGCGSNCTAEAAENAILAEKYADALLIVTPYYNKCTQNGLIAHYEAIQKCVKLPVIAYNVPGRTGVNLLPATAKIMADKGIIQGIKEASGNIEQITEICKLISNKIPVYSGDDALTVPAIKAGAKGVISVASNIVPKAISHIAEAALKGDYIKAEKLQSDFAPLITALFSEVNPIPVKTAAGLMNLCSPSLRLPLTPMEKPNLDNLKNIMKSLELIN